MLGWKAKTKDGRILSEFNEYGEKENAFGLLNYDELSEIFIEELNVSLDLQSGTFYISNLPIIPSFFENQPFPPCKKTPIFYRRHFVTSHGSTFIILLGWKTNIDGKRYKNMIYLLPQGLVCEFENLKKNSKLNLRRDQDATNSAR